jgi:hypothetical protein|tara:strand:+ start:206 stop:346 length:141 start_codon:yes stop_codon:yes gene_type:complete
METEIFKRFTVQERIALIKKSIDVLTLHGYTVIDLDGKLIKKQIQE